MGFRSALLNSLCYTIICVCILMPAWRMLSAWLWERIISAWSAILGLVLLFGLLVVSWHFGREEGAFIYVILLTTTNLLFPWFNRWLDGAAASHLRGDDMEKYRRAIEQDPTNAAAHEFLADALMELRRYDEAIAEYEIVVAQAKHTKTHEQWKLRRAIAAKEHQKCRSMVACTQCDALSPAGTATCPLCGKPLRFNLLAHLTRSPSAPHEGASPVPLLLRNIAIVLPVVFIILSPLPLPAKFWLLFLGAIVGGYFFLKRAGGD